MNQSTAGSRQPLNDEIESRIDQTAVKLFGIHKSFASVAALRGIDLSINYGQILALVGDNGAGKSTLIKILTGVHAPDRGLIEIEGKSYLRLNPALALNKGISAVYQDLALVDCLDVAGNLFLGREPTRGPFIDKKQMRSRSQELLQRLQLAIPSVTTPVKVLSGGQRQGIAIARTVNMGGKTIVFDEPTAAMGVKETKKVLETICKLRDQNHAIIVVSHNLHQVFAISDRVCVLQHGRIIGDLLVGQTSPEHIVRLMTGVEGAIADDE